MVFCCFNYFINFVIMNWKLCILFACRSLKDMYTGTDPQQKVNLASALVLDTLSPGLLMKLSESCERHARRCSSQFKFDSVAEILSHCSKLSSQLQPHVCNRIEHIDRLGDILQQNILESKISWRSGLPTPPRIPHRKINFVTDCHARGL